MNIQFTNFATGSLNAGISNSATSLTLNAGQGALFPALTGSQYFYAVITDAATKTTKEIVKVTARTTDTFTIVRGQDGTTGLTWLASDIVELRLTAAGIGDVASSAGISIVNAAITTNTTISGTHLYVPVVMASLGQSVTLPDATTLSVGGPQYIIDNTKGGYPAGIRDNTGTLLMSVAAGGEAFVSLKDNATAAGVWSITGTNLEPGLITIDSTFSSTYTNTVLVPFVALDNNTSIHFSALASGFAAFVVDNSGKVLTTPVTVDATASSTPKTIFKIDATHAIVFYGSSTTTNSCVVLTLSGSSPSYSLAIGTPQTYSTALGSNWDGENFIGAPKIAQLSSSIYVASNVNGTNTSVLAISVSGAVITLGTAANIITSSSVAASTTTYTLTGTTALVLYKSGAAAPYANNAVVVSVSGTTCTVGTPAAVTGCSSASTSPPSSVLLSATKAIIADDNNSTTTNIACAITISGTTVTPGTALTVETATGAGQQNNTFSGGGATRYTPHLWAIGANSAGYWYGDNTPLSRCVFLSESAGVITPGTILYGSISTAGTGAAGGGALLPISGGSLCSVSNQIVGSAGYFPILNTTKVSVSGATQGYGKPVRNIFPSDLANLSGAKLSSGDYLILPWGDSSGISGANSIPVFRSNGDVIAYRGDISTPQLKYAQAKHTFGTTGNRLVILASTVSTAVSVGTYQLRLLNVEIAA